MSHGQDVFENKLLTLYANMLLKMHEIGFFKVAKFRNLPSNPRQANILLKTNILTLGAPFEPTMSMITKGFEGHWGLVPVIRPLGKE
jgi:hypothetical protein